MANPKPPASSIFAKKISLGGVNLEQKAVFARNLAIMLKAGITISEALAIVVEIATGKLKKITSHIYKSVQSGQSFAASLGMYPKVFSGIFINTVFVGEKSGTLYENLEAIAQQLDKDREMRSKVKGAMLYPTVVLIAAGILGLVIAFVVFPKIIPLFKGLKIKLPITTLALIWLSEVIQAHGFTIIISLAALVFFLIWFCRQKFSHPFTHWLTLKTPLIAKITLAVNLSRFCRTFGMLLKSGVNIDEAVKITGDSLDNFYYRRALHLVYEHIGKGTTVAENLSAYKELFPTMLVRMVMVGEKSGKLEETLFYLADFYELEVNNRTKSLSTAIEPALLIIIGLVVGFLALSIITPIYSITGGLK
ncbi:MAG: type II secretion system F family protein [Candidatus Falkowbacteria bacterium]|nr:type II secretion system F family protein [Candidatus Falkowbacteria bacterium]